MRSTRSRSVMQDLSPVQQRTRTARYGHCEASFRGDDDVGSCQGHAVFLGGVFLAFSPSWIRRRIASALAGRSPWRRRQSWMGCSSEADIIRCTRVECGSSVLLMPRL